MRKPVMRRKGTDKAELVLAALRKAQRPVSAYDIISALRGRADLAPPTVYRALDRLIEASLVHKLESLNAFVACSQAAHHDDAAFAICDSCGSVTEFHTPAIDKTLRTWSCSNAFELNATMVELHGTCATCLDSGGDDHTHA